MELIYHIFALDTRKLERIYPRNAGESDDDYRLRICHTVEPRLPPIFRKTYLQKNLRLKANDLIYEPSSIPTMSRIDVAFFYGVIEGTVSRTDRKKGMICAIEMKKQQLWLFTISICRWNTYTKFLNVPR